MKSEDAAYPDAAAATAERKFLREQAEPIYRHPLRAIIQVDY
jgi:hypothetical protein